MPLDSLAIKVPYSAVGFFTCLPILTLKYGP